MGLMIKGGMVNAKSRESLENGRKYQTLNIQETFDCFSAVRGFGSEVYELQKALQINRTLTRLSIELSWRQDAITTVMCAFSGIYALAMMRYGGSLVRDGRLHGSDLLMFFIQFGMVGHGMTTLGYTFERGGMLGNQLRHTMHLMNRESAMPLDEGLAP